MEYIIVIGVILILVIPVIGLWVSGIDYMNKNHPDYKGDDLFGLDEDDKTQIG
jgi:hypothetical protein